MQHVGWLSREAEGQRSKSHCQIIDAAFDMGLDNTLSSNLLTQLTVARLTHGTIARST